MDLISQERSPVVMNFNSRWGNTYNKSPKIRRSSMPASAHELNFLNARRRSCATLLRRECKIETTTATNLNTVTLTSLLQSKEWQPISSVLATETISSILEKLGGSKQYISTVISEDGRALGTIDIIDLVSLCYEILNSNEDIDGALLNCREFFQKQTAVEFLQRGYGCRMVSVFSQASLLDVIQLFTNPEVKRVAILKDGRLGTTTWEDISVIVSDRDILRFLNQNPHLVNAHLEASQCISNSPSVDTISENMVRDKYLIGSSFRAIWDKQITGGVNSHGHLFLDKFTNWITHIIRAELPIEDLIVPPTVKATELFKMFVDQSTDRVLISEESGSFTQVAAVDVLRSLLDESEVSAREL